MRDAWDERRQFFRRTHFVDAVAINSYDVPQNTNSHSGLTMSNTRTKDAPTIFNMGRYEDQYVKQHGQWLIAQRLIIADMGYEPKLPAPPAAKQ
ncbi:MAG TPA: nuclear transport factor 2 family protein [Steroidobacteraceae bacterium]|nr:nuclear transport factor 2 family protein [Steroidobacteraceae bacterium]